MSVALTPKGNTNKMLKYLAFKMTSFTTQIGLPYLLFVGSDFYTYNFHWHTYQELIISKI